MQLAIVVSRASIDLLGDALFRQHPSRVKLLQDRVPADKSSMQTERASLQHGFMATNTSLNNISFGESGK